MKDFAAHRPPPDFDRLTGMDSRSLVTDEVDELRRHFGTEPPADIEAELLRRLLAFFALHGSWRAHILHEPDPEFVKVFLRRWSSELLFHRCRALYERLPRSYRTGAALSPSRPLPLALIVEPGLCLNRPVTIS